MYILTLDIPAEKDFPELSAGVLVDYFLGCGPDHIPLDLRKATMLGKKITKHIVNGGARW